MVGDIVSVMVNSTGWQAEITVEGLGTGGSYDLNWGPNNTVKGPGDLPKVRLVVTSLGYDASGVLTTLTRTVYGTKAVRKAYPNQGQADEVAAGGNVTVKVALSDYVYARDNPGAGNSGVAVRCEIEDGFYTQGGNASGMFLLAEITNNSSAAYPKVVGNWSWPGFERITGPTLKLRCVAFHRSGQLGRPVAAVRFTASDQHGMSVGMTVMGPTLDAGMPDAVPVLEYVAEIPAGSLTQGDVITCNFEGLPFVGDSESVLNTGDGVNPGLTPLYGPLKLLCDTAGTYGVTVAVVDPVAGNDGTGVAVDQGTFNPLSPPAAFLTIGRAAAAIAAYNNAQHGRNDVGGGVVYLRAGNHAWVGSSNAYGLTPNSWLTVRPFPGVGRSEVVINGASGNGNISGRVKLQELTVTAAAASTFNGIEVLWWDRCVINSAGTALVTSTPVWYVTHCSLAQLGQGLKPWSTAQTTAPALVRGNGLEGFAKGIMCYTVLGNRKSDSSPTNLFVQHIGGQTAPVSSHPILAFNVVLGWNDGSAMPVVWFDLVNTTHGAAVVANVLEARLNMGSALAEIAAGEGGTGNDNVQHVLVWHNTWVGSKCSLGYNSSGATLKRRWQWSVVNNVLDDWNIKTDDFVSDPNGARVGNWPVLYGVGFSGNIFAESAGIGGAGSFLNEWAGISSVQNAGQGASWLGFVGRRSFDGLANGAGNGDYRVLASSPAVGLPVVSVLPKDLAGRERGPVDYAGAYGLGRVGGRRARVLAPRRWLGTRRGAYLAQLNGRRKRLANA